MYGNSERALRMKLRYKGTSLYSFYTIEVSVNLLYSIIYAWLPGLSYFDTACTVRIVAVNPVELCTRSRAHVLYIHTWARCFVYRKCSRIRRVVELGPYPTLNEIRIEAEFPCKAEFWHMYLYKQLRWAKVQDSAVKCSAVAKSTTVAWIYIRDYFRYLT